jgi:hypothetical protein
MYKLISKPKRMSLAAGVSHFIAFLHKGCPRLAVLRPGSLPAETVVFLNLYRKAASVNHGFGTHDFHEFQHLLWLERTPPGRYCAKWD